MDNYFSEEIKKIKREITALKTAMQKSAGQIEFDVKSVNFSIPLSLNASQTQASGSVSFKIVSDKPVLFFATLDKYYDDITKAGPGPILSRYFTTYQWVDLDGIVIQITGNGTQGPNSDVTTLINGGSVTLSGKLTVKCTDQFTLRSF